MRVILILPGSGIPRPHAAASHCCLSVRPASISIPMHCYWLCIPGVFIMSRLSSRHVVCTCVLHHSCLQSSQLLDATATHAKPLAPQVLWSLVGRLWCCCCLRLPLLQCLYALQQMIMAYASCLDCLASTARCYNDHPSVLHRHPPCSTCTIIMTTYTGLSGPFDLMRIMAWMAFM